jgi:hypothetical protein
MRKLVCRPTLLIYALVAVGLSSLALGDETSKRAKLDELMVLEKRDEVVEQILQDHKRQSQDLAARQLNYYREILQFADTDPYYVQMVAAAQRYLDAILPPYTAKEATTVYADLLSKHLDEADVDAVLAFAKSPAGQRAIEARRLVALQWQETLGQKATESTMKHNKVFQDEMVRIAAERMAQQISRPKQPKRHDSRRAIRTPDGPT